MDTSDTAIAARVDVRWRQMCRDMTDGDLTITIQQLRSIVAAASECKCQASKAQHLSFQSEIDIAEAELRRRRPN